VEILNWLDDRSLCLLAGHAYGCITGQSVISTFLAADSKPGTTSW
jgi:hypothetical protein